MSVPVELKETSDSIEYKYPEYSATWEFAGDRIFQTIIFTNLRTRKPGSDKILVYRLNIIDDFGNPNIELCPHKKSMDLLSDGLVIMNYRGLKITDAEGKDIQFHIINLENSLSWKIFDSKAVYPITLQAEFVLNLEHIPESSLLCDSEYFDRSDDT